MKGSGTFGRPLAALLALCLAAGPLSAVARAEGEADDYAREVFALLEDPQYTGTITLRQDVALGEVKFVWVYGSENGEKVLNLNGHTMTCQRMDNYADLYLIDSAGGGALILTNGALTNNATLTIEGATVICTTVNASPIHNNLGKCFRLVSGSVKAEGRCAIMNGGGTCTIDGGTICGKVIAITSYPGVELYPAYGQDENGEIIGSTGTRFHDATLIINGGDILGNVEISSTDTTITGGTIRGSIKGERDNGNEAEKIEYHAASGELVALPLPTYELHEDNGEMKRGYWDVPMDAWFYTPVQTLMDDRVLDYGGYDDKGNFGPAEPLTRGQAAALLVRSCGAEVEEEVTEPPFLDVSDTTPYAKYINAGKKLSLLSGDGQGQFHPESAITRQEFAVLVMNAVHRYGWELPSEAPGVVFQDEDAIAPWAKDAVAEGADVGLWNGTPGGDFLPLAPITRAESAAILSRLIQTVDPR